jgi:hypothetical protein
MTGALDRVASFLVEPAAPAAGGPLPTACRAAVLGRPRDVIPLAAAVALTLRAADRCPAALVAAWGAALPARGPAVRAAKRLAAAADDGATARGRLAWLGLPPEPARAVDALVEAATVVDAPLVTALAGARPPTLEALVSGHDLVVVAAAPGTPLAHAVVARLAERGVPAIACAPLARAAVRALAVAGLAAPRLDLATAGLAEPRLGRAGDCREAG